MWLTINKSSLTIARARIASWHIEDVDSGNPRGSLFSWGAFFMAAPSFPHSRSFLRLASPRVLLKKENWEGNENEKKTVSQMVGNPEWVHLQRWMGKETDIVKSWRKIPLGRSSTCLSFRNSLFRFLRVWFKSAAFFLQASRAENKEKFRSKRSYSEHTEKEGKWQSRGSVMPVENQKWLG